MMRKYMSFIIIFSSSVMFSSEQDLFKRLEKEMRTVEVGPEGVELFQNFMNHMQAIKPDDKGNREVGYEIIKVKKNKMRISIDKITEEEVAKVKNNKLHLSVNHVEELFNYDETFPVFKGFRITSEGSVSISRDLDVEQFDMHSAPMIFLKSILDIFNQQVGRVRIPLGEDAAFVFSQSKCTSFVLGSAKDERGFSKRLE